MQAFGNDYVYIDAIHQHLDNLPELARFVSDRHFAIGSDGMVLICPSEKGNFRMRISERPTSARSSARTPAPACWR